MGGRGRHWLKGLHGDGHGLGPRAAPRAREHGPEGAAPRHRRARDVLPAGALVLLHVQEELWGGYVSRLCCPHVLCM